MKHHASSRGNDQRHNRPGYPLRPARQQDHHRQRKQRDNGRVSICAAGVFEQEAQARQKLARHRRRLQSEEIFDFSGCDQQCNAVGETDSDRPRNKAYRGAEAGRAHHDQNRACHQRDHGKSFDAELRDDTRHNDDKRAGRAANLYPGATKSGNQKTGNDCRVETGLRRHARGNPKSHRQRERDQTHGNTGGQVLGKRVSGVIPEAEKKFRLPPGGVCGRGVQFQPIRLSFASGLFRITQVLATLVINSGYNRMRYRLTVWTCAPFSVKFERNRYDPIGSYRRLAGTTPDTIGNCAELRRPAAGTADYSARSNFGPSTGRRRRRIDASSHPGHISIRHSPRDGLIAGDRVIRHYLVPSHGSDGPDSLLPSQSRRFV
jgi:hypothetical protein